LQVENSGGDGDDGGQVQSGLALSIPGDPKKKAHAGQSRMEALMEQYKKQTEEHHKRQEREQAALKGPDAATRSRMDAGLRAKARRYFGRQWKRITSCLDCLCNGASDTEQARLDSAPIVLGGVHRKVAERLCVTQDHLRKLRTVFRRIDYNGFGNIMLEEVFEYVGEDPNPFLDRLYAQLVASQTGDYGTSKLLSFENFVLFVLVFGSMSEGDVLKFVFESFDADGSGHLEPDEIIALLGAINRNKPLYPGNYTKMLQEFDTDQDGRISYKEFKALHKAYPIALFPVFRMYDQLQEKTLGAGAFVEMGRATLHLREMTDAQKNFRKVRLAEEAEKGSESDDDGPPATPAASAGAGAGKKAGSGAGGKGGGSGNSSPVSPTGGKRDGSKK